SVPGGAMICWRWDSRHPHGPSAPVAGSAGGGDGMPPQASREGRRVLIVNADDFGLSDGVTAGIVRAWREGVVTSTSAMINMDGAPERVAAARRSCPELPIGLHLNITAGRPVLPPEKVPTLV